MGQTRLEIRSILEKFGKAGDIVKLNKRCQLYIFPIEELITENTDIENWICGLQLMYAFCMYEDILVDTRDAMKEDSLLALYFQNEYLQWLLNSYGKEEVQSFAQAIKRFIDYTETEKGAAETFKYNFQNYKMKEEPIINHIKLLGRHLGKESADIIEFIEFFYTVILINDDIADLETDVKNGQNTFVTAMLRRENVDPQYVQIKSRDYWKIIEKNISPWLNERLKQFENFSQTTIYRNILLISNDIYQKLH